MKNINKDTFKDTFEDFEEFIEAIKVNYQNMINWKFFYPCFNDDYEVAFSHYYINNIRVSDRKDKYKILLETKDIEQVIFFFEEIKREKENIRRDVESIAFK